MNNTIKMSISYITNFQPLLLNNFSNINLFTNRNKTKLISKNFILFLLLLKSHKKGLDIKFFIKPKYKKFITLLRAPYRYKLSRHQFLIKRYYITMSLKIKSKKINLTHYKDVLFLIQFFKKFYVWFESNIVFQHQVKLFFKFNFKNNFLIYF